MWDDRDFNPGSLPGIPEAPHGRRIQTASLNKFCRRAWGILLVRAEAEAEALGKNGGFSVDDLKGLMAGVVAQ